MSDSPRAYYDDNGYYIARRVVPEGLIDQLLASYRSSVLISKNPFFRQSTNRWTRSQLSPRGYATDSFRDPHDYPSYPEFCTDVRAILCAPEVRRALTEVTGSAEHRVMQSMLFDQNVGTPPHQDWYYLDSMPNGHLLAAWIALEDIDERAGRFFVFPKSHRLELDPTGNLPYNEYLKIVEKYFSDHRGDAHAPELKKGDVLFWNSRVIHGSLPTQDQDYSRKSLTAHYLPDGFLFGSRNAKFPVHVDYDLFQGMQVRRSLPIHKHYTLSARIQTDVFAFMYDRPALRQLALSIAARIKR